MFLTGAVICFLLFGTYDYIDNAFAFLLLFAFCYLVGLIYHHFVYVLGSKLGLNNRYCLIRRSLAEVIKENEALDSDTMSQISSYMGYNDKVLKVKYFEAYSHLQMIHQLGSVPTLEAQSSFCRNMWPLTLWALIKAICSVCGCCSCSCMGATWSLDTCHSSIKCLVLIVLASLIVLIPLARNLIEKKIHKVVWEAVLYLQEGSGSPS